MAERIPDSLIDDILSSTKKYSTGATSQETYSAVDIDFILDDAKAYANRSENIVIEQPKEEKKEFSFNLEKKEKTKKAFSLNFAKIEEAIEDESLDEDVFEVEEEEENEFEDIYSDEQSDEVEEAEEVEEVKPITGQISIEKTRMFNEVDVRGKYNPNILHNLGNKVIRTTSGDAEPLSTPVADENKYKKHFFSKPVQKIESTAEHLAITEGMPQKTIETPGIVVKNRQSSQSTDGIAPVPTLVPAEYEYEQEKTKMLTDIISDAVEDDNQIMFDGFVEKEEILQQSEEQAEAELRENRKDKVKDFVDGNLLFKQEVDETTPKKRYARQRVSVAREFFGPKDENALRKIFEGEKKATFIKLVAVSVICLVMSVLAAIAGADNGNFELYDNNEFVYSLFQLVLLVIASLTSIRSFTNAINNIKNLIIDMDTVVALAAIMGAIQCLISFAFTDSVESVASLTTGAAVVPMILKYLGEFIQNKNDSENFEVLTANLDDCYSVENIQDEDTANEISRGLLLADPEIKYSVKTGFPQKFVELSRLADVTGQTCKITVLLSLAVGAVVGMVAMVMSSNFFVGISALTASVLMGLPMATGVVSAINLRATNKLLNEEGAFINGYTAVEDAVNSNGVMIDSCEAFEEGGCNIEGMKTYHKMRIDEAILYTASVVIAAGGVLADVFEGVIDGKRELLLPVESLAYEEKLGCSCWIHNHRALVGNRDLLVHHNVETPDKELEEKYRQMGKNVVYLAIEGKIAAMFIVVYKANQETARYMRELEKDGLTIFFRTSDANITEKFLEREFGLPENVVKIINPVAGDMFTKISRAGKASTDAKIIHNGSAKSMLAALHGSFVINSFVNSSRLIQLIASAIGVAIIALLTFLSGLSQIGVWQILMYQAVWAVILSAPAFTRKK